MTAGPAAPARQSRPKPAIAPVAATSLIANRDLFAHELPKPDPLTAVPAKNTAADLTAGASSMTAIPDDQGADAAPCRRSRCN